MRELNLEDLSGLIKYEVSDKETIYCRRCNQEIKGIAHLLIDPKAKEVVFVYCPRCVNEYRKEELAKHRKDVY
ncbi:MAG: hypothetical protein ACLFVI_07315 [Archaeoglobaceae archaeon]